MHDRSSQASPGDHMSNTSKAILLSNFAPSEHFRAGSFLDILHERGVWDHDAFWALDKALRDLFRQDEIAGGDPNLVWPVFRIYSYLNVLLRAHSDPNDGYKISNMQPAHFRDWCERVQLTFEGFMKGDMLGNEMFELVNPKL